MRCFICFCPIFMIVPMFCSTCSCSSCVVVSGLPTIASLRLSSKPDSLCKASKWPSAFCFAPLSMSLAFCTSLLWYSSSTSWFFLASAKPFLASSTALFNLFSLAWWIALSKSGLSRSSSPCFSWFCTSFSAASSTFWWYSKIFLF